MSEVRRALSKREIKDLKPQVEKIVHKLVGSRETLISNVAMDGISAGYDRRKIAEELSGYLDSHKAAKLADRLSDMLADQRNLTRKRTHEESDGKREAKKPRDADNGEVNSSPAVLTPNQIEEMMKNAQRLIRERKRALEGDPTQPPVHQPVITPSAVSLPTPTLARPDLSAMAAQTQQKIKELQSQIQSKIAQLPTAVVKQPDKPTPLILDAEGRTVDDTGREIQLVHRIPTLKANIRAIRREHFRAQLAEKIVDDIGESKYFDGRLATKAAVRAKKQFKFHEKGKFIQMAQQHRAKAQLEKLHNDIAQIAKKTGIQSSAKLAMIAPKQREEPTGIPLVEWWDDMLLAHSRYPEDGAEPDLIEESITNLVEHPIQLAAPGESSGSKALPIFLTKDERKKLRRQNRREAWKEKQEKIRIGLEAPPEAKMKMSNLMRVLGTQAVADPTKMEAHVREQMAKRLKAHEEANQARKLTAEQKAEKRVNKLKEDTSNGVSVQVFRVTDLTSASKKFKVEKNATQLFLTGTCVLYRNVNVVVVEGGPKQMRKYNRLMMNRIKWAEDDDSNKCHLVWQGQTKNRAFSDFKFKLCPNENFAREHFKKHGVEQYWDLAYSGAVLSNSEET